MTNEKAVEVLQNGGWWDELSPDMSDADEEPLHEALDAAIAALKRPPNLCTILGVWPEQVFNWRGYTLKVRSDGVVGKKMVGDSWPGLEGPMVCGLINNADEIMRKVQLDLVTCEPLTLTDLCGMIGEPIWVVPAGDDPDWIAQWNICKEDYLMVYSVTSESRVHLLKMENYGKTWLAYRRKPKEVQ